jgi:hypothetical protein
VDDLQKIQTHDEQNRREDRKKRKDAHAEDKLLSHKGIKARNPKLEIRNKSQISSLQTPNDGLDHCDFIFGTCFEFRA